MVGKSRLYIEGNGEEDSILREDFVLAFVELPKLEEKTGVDFTVKSGGRIAMKVVVSILPEKDDLGEEEGDEALRPNLAGEFRVVYVEMAVMGVLKSCPLATDITAEELVPSNLCLAVTGIVEG